MSETEIETVQGVLAEFSRVEAGLAAIREKHGNTVYEITTTAGMNAAKAARAEIRAPRYAVEQVRKSAKAPLLALGRRIDAEAARITEALLAIEGPIDGQIKAEEARRAAEKEAKKAAEVERLRQEAAAKLREEEERLAAERARLKEEKARVAAEAERAAKEAEDKLREATRKAGEVLAEARRKIDEEKARAAAEAERERARIAAEREAVEATKRAEVVVAEVVPPPAAEDDSDPFPWDVFADEWHEWHRGLDSSQDEWAAKVLAAGRAQASELDKALAQIEELEARLAISIT